MLQYFLEKPIVSMSKKITLSLDESVSIGYSIFTSALFLITIIGVFYHRIKKRKSADEN